MKKLFILLALFISLQSSAKNPFNNGNHYGQIKHESESESEDEPADAPDYDPDATNVPFDDFVPFLVSCAIIYGIAIKIKFKRQSLEHGK
jgi:hypothetical protein